MYMGCSMLFEKPIDAQTAARDLKELRTHLVVANDIWEEVNTLISSDYNGLFLTFAEIEDRNEPTARFYGHILDSVSFTVHFKPCFYDSQPAFWITAEIDGAQRPLAEIQLVNNSSGRGHRHENLVSFQEESYGYYYLAKSFIEQLVVGIHKSIPREQLIEDD